MQQDIEDAFSAQPPTITVIQKEIAHGRIEISKCSVILDLERINGKYNLKDIRYIIKIEADVYDKKSQTHSTAICYYINS